MSITQILLEKGLLAQEQMDEAVALQKSDGVRLDRAIIQLGFLTEHQLLEVMSEQLHLPLVNLSETTIDPQVLKACPPRSCIASAWCPSPAKMAPSRWPPATRSICMRSTTCGC